MKYSQKHWDLKNHLNSFKALKWNYGNENDGNFMPQIINWMKPQI